MISLLLLTATLVAWALHLSFAAPLMLALSAINFGFILGRRTMRRDVLLVRGFNGIRGDDARASASAADMRDAYRKASLPTPVILNAPDHIRVERIKTI